MRILLGQLSWGYKPRNIVIGHCTYLRSHVTGPLWFYDELGLAVIKLPNLLNLLKATPPAYKRAR